MHFLILGVLVLVSDDPVKTMTALCRTFSLHVRIRICEYEAGMLTVMPQFPVSVALEHCFSKCGLQTTSGS